MRLLLSDELERIYKEHYPRKIGKTLGLKRARRLVPIDEIDLFELSVKNYAKFCEGKDKQFIKFFSTFVNEWEDWLEYEPEDPNDINIGKINARLRI